MYLKSRFKSLPSVFLEVAIYSGLGSPPPLLYWLFPLLQKRLKCSHGTKVIHLTHGNCLCFPGSFLFSEYWIVKIIPHHQTLLLMDICATFNILTLQTQPKEKFYEYLFIFLSASLWDDHTNASIVTFLFTGTTPVLSAVPQNTYSAHVLTTRLGIWPNQKNMLSHCSMNLSLLLFFCEWD